MPSVTSRLKRRHHARLHFLNKGNGGGQSAMLALEAREVSVDFGGVRALDGISLEIKQTEIVGLIGPNGAGKTTFVNVLSGFQRPTSGSIYLDSRDVTGRSPRQLARWGIARTFQSGQLFQELSVCENVEVSAIGRGTGLGDARKEADSLLERLGLGNFAGTKVNTLPFTSQCRVGIARALALKPLFILLDEPAAGLNEDECNDLMGVIMDLHKDFQCGVLLIDHNIQVVIQTCERIHVIDGGRMLAVGTPAEVRNNASVIAAYFGSGRT